VEQVQNSIFVDHQTPSTTQTIRSRLLGRWP